MKTPKRIVAEVSKNWPQQTAGTLAGRFEAIIEYNTTRGFELESWRLSTAIGNGTLSETIIAVFVERENK